MKKLTKILFLLSVAGFLGGVLIDCDGTVDPRWTVVLPLGAVFFGLFLIFHMLQKEMAVFDRETTETPKAESGLTQAKQGGDGK